MIIVFLMNLININVVCIDDIHRWFVYISKHSLDVFKARQCIAVKEREMQSSMNHS
jgi:hypothetical protein